MVLQTLVLIEIVTADDQVKAYIKKIMGQLKEWMYGGKISKLVVVITSKETGEHVERWQFDVSFVEWRTERISDRFQVQIFGKNGKTKSSKTATDNENSAPEYGRSTHGRYCALTAYAGPPRGQKRKPRLRYKLRSSPSFDRSLPLLLSCPC